MSLFIARQPIFTAQMKLVAYELLFRDGNSNTNAFPPDMDSDVATSKLISGLEFNKGITSFTDGKLAYINFTETAIINGQPLLFEPQHIVIEVLESARPTKSLLRAIKDLHEKGYVIALDDYVDQPVWRHFFAYVSVIKMDLLNTDITALQDFQQTLNSQYPHIELLAEKVETHGAYHHVKSLGFNYFQGYFFSHPEIIESRVLSLSQNTITHLLATLLNEHAVVDDILTIIQTDSTLSYKLLRYAQSPLFKRKQDITSIKQAVVILGIQELKRFASLLFASEMTKDKHAELNKLALCRAKFCELIDLTTKHPELPGDAFLSGLLSLMDAMLDAELTPLIEQVPVNGEVKEAICHGRGKLGQYLALAKHYETPNVATAEGIITELGLSSEHVNSLYLAALSWSNESAKGI